MHFYIGNIIGLAAFFALHPIILQAETAPCSAEILEEKAFDYFWNTCTTNGFMPDPVVDPPCVTTEGSGFQLTALCLGAQRGWITRDDARISILQVLNNFAALPRFHGFWARHYEYPSLRPVEYSHQSTPGGHTLSTAYLAAGLYTARTVFNQTDNETETQIRELCRQLLDSIEWDWMLSTPAGHTAKTLAAWWNPESGFDPDVRLDGRQDFRGALAYLLAIASTTHPIPAVSWNEGFVPTLEWITEQNTSFISCPSPAYLLQPQVWLNLQHRRDRTADYAQSTLLAIRANHGYAVITLYPGTPLWGITDCLGPNGYERYGVPPLIGPVEQDAVICPAAAIASMPFTPALTKKAMESFYTDYRHELWGEYGFYDSFSPKNNWFAKQYSTVHQGLIMGMLANAKDQVIQQWFMSNPEISEALDQMGFYGMLDGFEDRPRGTDASLLLESSLEYAARLSYETAPEGRYSLYIEYNKRAETNAPLSFVPALKDFSSYHYFALWIKGNADPSFMLEDENGRQTQLGRAIKGPSFDGWRKVYFPLPADAPDFSLSGVRRILMDADPSKNRASGSLFIDQLHLVNLLSLKQPAVPANFQIRETRMPGELNLSWRIDPSNTNAASPFRYHLRYASEPIRNDRAFRRASPVPGGEQIRAEGVSQSFSTTIPSSLQPWYFAIRAEDMQGIQSDITCSEPVLLTEKKLPVEFPLEHFDAALPHLRWTSSGPALTATPTEDASLEGGGSLEITYHKEGEESRWACLTAYTDVHNMDSYRYLSMWVAGTADLVLRFVDSHGAQQDTTVEKTINPDAWSPVFFDLTKLNRIDRRSVERIMLFVEPDKVNIAGTIYIDSISLCNTRN